MGSQVNGRTQKGIFQDTLRIKMSSRSCSESSDCVSSNALLWEGARKGDISKVREALEEGADVNSRANSKGSTSLHLASAEGHVEVVKILLEGGADSNLADRCGWSSLDKAVWAGRMGVCRVLIEKGPRLTQEITSIGHRCMPQQFEETF